MLKSNVLTTLFYFYENRDSKLKIDIREYFENFSE